MKKRILILLVLSFIHCFAAKTTDYVDKTDVENSKKIFINIGLKYAYLLYL